MKYADAFTTAIAAQNKIHSWSEVTNSKIPFRLKSLVILPLEVSNDEILRTEICNRVIEHHQDNEMVLSELGFINKDLEVFAVGDMDGRTLTLSLQDFLNTVNND